MSLARYPIIVLMARPARIARLRDEASYYVWATTVDYPDEGFQTTHDADYAAALRRRKANHLTYRAIAIFGPAALVEHLVGKFALYGT